MRLQQLLPEKFDDGGVERTMECASIETGRVLANLGHPRSQRLAARSKKRVVIGERHHMRLWRRRQVRLDDVETPAVHRDLIVVGLP